LLSFRGQSGNKVSLVDLFRMKTFFVYIFFFCTLFTFGQNPVNAYAQVIAINDSTLLVSAVDEQYDTFEDGEKIILMQMQGVTVSDSSNSSSFGNINSIGSAGLFEVAQIFSHSENGGVPDTIKLSAALQHTYNTYATVQIISFPVLGNGSSFASTSNMGCRTFNGVTGGVVCFEVQGNFYLSHNITADGAGFKGGSKSLSGNGSDCDPSLYAGYYDDKKSLKGQSVYKVASQVAAGRAHSANGGGGGVVHNGGGAGGANYSGGGDGGEGWIHCSTVLANGLGGQSMDQWISPERIFLGGGGGGGHDNENVGTNGANGGGIIIIKCDSLMTAGSCSGITISANGSNAASDANDGKGGGGAGGSVLLDVQLVKSTASCPLLIRANGGNGGNVTISKQHGGGGGGGQGVVMILCGGTSENVVMQTKNGKGGKNMSSFNPTYAYDGVGTDDAGIFIGLSSDTFPAVISSYSALQDSFAMEIKWQTVYEKNVASFELQKAYLTNPWQVIATLPGHGSGIYTGITDYVYTDNAPWDDANYFRLRISDTAGCNFYSPTWSGNWTRPEYSVDVVVYQGAGRGEEFFIRSNFDFDPDWFEIYDVRGRLVTANFYKVSSKLYKFVTQPLEEAVYFVRYYTNDKKGAKKFLFLKPE
jgi:hypothetical protein